MCRWLAYIGPPVEMAALVLRPRHSLVRQSLSSSRGVTPVNGDGFGLAWWGNKPEPGRFCDTLPAWNDANLRSLTEQIESRLFFAHVRASTGTETSRANCHPFTYRHMGFMHNGQIGGWYHIRRAVEALIPDDLYRERKGTTDTEALFLLAVANGLLDDPLGGLARAVGLVRGEMLAAGITQPFRMTSAISDGERVVCARWSSDGQSPSLFSAPSSAISGFTSHDLGLENAWLILSEPLDEEADDWSPVAEGSALIAAPDSAVCLSFEPELPA
ncbi:MAG: class II glutamine amidotransferase [Alphaproteobacteria bacterium]|nr:class II glutamine amidotransferase [Alphaproteobacteria bacterium]MCB9930850.1 class II glutamine amidotransferase [Alphaproteobacteria bacterium]